MSLSKSAVKAKSVRKDKGKQKLVQNAFNRTRVCARNHTQPRRQRWETIIICKKVPWGTLVHNIALRCDLSELLKQAGGVHNRRYSFESQKSA